MLSIKQMTPAQKNAKLHQISNEKKELQKKLKHYKSQGWIGLAASAEKKIKDLSLEFSEIYNSL